MEKNNKKTKMNLFTKLFMIIILSIFSILSVSAMVQFEDTQNITQPNYFSSNWLSYISDNDGIVNINETETYSLTFSTNIGYILLAGRITTNDTQIAYLNYYDENLQSYILKNYTIPSGEIRLIQLDPQNIGDTFKFNLTSSTGNLGYNIIFTNLGSGFNVAEVVSETTIFTPLINGVVDLIIINVTLWKLAFYIIILLFVIGTIVSLIWLAIKFYKWGQENSVFKKRSNHR